MTNSNMRRCVRCLSRICARFLLAATAILAIDITLRANGGEALAAVTKSDEKDGLFMATPVPVAGFTELIEGPACDSAGNLYAVGFGPPENIGRVTPEGKAEVFVTLPGKSTGNGIVFDHAGTMYVADYVGHNVLKIDPKTQEDLPSSPTNRR